MLHKRNAFSFLEIMVAVIIAGLIAAVAIPRLGKVIPRSDERNAIVNLKTMRAAVRTYLANSGDPLIPDNLDTLSLVNGGLELSLTDPRSTYLCWDVGGTQPNGCRADLPDGSTLHFHMESPTHNDDGSIHCDSGACPTCPNGGFGDCG